MQISVSPARYELEIEHARLEHRQNFQPRAQVNTTPSALKIETKNGELRLDTYEARKSMGFTNVGDSVKQAAIRGAEALTKGLRATVEMGKQLSRIDQGTTIGQVMTQKLSQSPQLHMSFLPSGGVGVSWNPNEINIDYQMGKTEYDWQVKSNEMSYVPGSVRLRLIENFKVDVEYVGSPLYFPRSANPEYKEA